MQGDDVRRGRFEDGIFGMDIYMGVYMGILVFLMGIACCFWIGSSVRFDGGLTMLDGDGIQLEWWNCAW